MWCLSPSTAISGAHRPTAWPWPPDRSEVCAPGAWRPLGPLGGLWRGSSWAIANFGPVFPRCQPPTSRRCPAAHAARGRSPRLRRPRGATPPGCSCWIPVSLSEEGRTKRALENHERDHMSLQRQDDPHVTDSARLFVIIINLGIEKMMFRGTQRATMSVSAPSSSARR